MGRQAINLIALSVADQELIAAFCEIAREECGALGWDEIEPVLAECWARSLGPSTALTWQHVSAYVRDACSDNVKG